ncbi:hypothetical protein ILYODFUR_024267 [Ilyodon furcidens]|uniref:Uncharacterized protein n=1 Tax=Ilyodon furcidens TaxID=33524 RepID=A0ABV0VGP2_9TELE
MLSVKHCSPDNCQNQTLTSDCQGKRHNPSLQRKFSDSLESRGGILYITASKACMHLLGHGNPFHEAFYALLLSKYKGHMKFCPLKKLVTSEYNYYPATMEGLRVIWLKSSQHVMLYDTEKMRHTR